jgi:hypothetical protein
MLPFGLTVPATVPKWSEIPEGLMNNPVYKRPTFFDVRKVILKPTTIKHTHTYVEEDNVQIS